MHSVETIHSEKKAEYFSIYPAYIFFTDLLLLFFKCSYICPKLPQSLSVFEGMREKMYIFERGMWINIFKMCGFFLWIKDS